MSSINAKKIIRVYHMIVILNRIVPYWSTNITVIIESWENAHVTLLSIERHHSLDSQEASYKTDC